MRRFWLALLCVGLALPVAAQSPVYRESLQANLSAANAFVSLDTKGLGTATVSVGGTFVGTLTFEVIAADGGVQSLNCTPPDSTTATTTTTTTGRWGACVVAGFPTFRVRMSSYTSGTANVVLSGVAAGGGGGSSISGSFSGNAAASATGSSVPASAGYTGVNIGGTLTGATGVTAGSQKLLAAGIFTSAGAQIDTFGGGTQYAEGATAATITGTAVMFESNTGTNTLAVVNSTTPLPVTAVVTSMPSTTVTATNLDVQIGGSDTVQVQSNSANLATQTTAAAILAKQPALGTAGSASTDVITVQGSASGTAIPVSVASIPSHAVTNAGTFAVQADTELTTADLDSGAGTDTRAVVGLVFSASGGATPVSASAGLPVNIVSGAGSGGTALADGGTFTASATSATPASGFYEASPSTCTTGKACAIGLTTNREQKVALYSGGTALTQDTQLTGDGAITHASTTGGAMFSRASAAAPTDVSADNDAVMPWALRSGASVTQPSYGGTLASTGVGAAGTGVPRVNDTASGTTGSAPPTQAGYVGGITSGATGGLLGGITVCDQQAFLDMTTATTTELVALTSGRKVHVCYWLAMGNGATTMTFKRGTGTNCGTGTTTISNAWELTAQVGFSGGSGIGEIFDNQTAANALCVTNSAAVNLHIFVRYAIY